MVAGNKTKTKTIPIAGSVAGSRALFAGTLYSFLAMKLGGNEQIDLEGLMKIQWRKSLKLWVVFDEQSTTNGRLAGRSTDSPSFPLLLRRLIASAASKNRFFPKTNESAAH